MNEVCLQTGIDFGARWVDVCVLSPTGEPLVDHQRFANSLPGYQQAKQLLLDTLATQPEHGLNISGEATGMYWLPFFLQLAADAELAAYTPNLYLLNPRWVAWFKKCFAQDDKSDQKDPFYIAERTRTRPPTTTWTPDTANLALRFYTRYRFHLVQRLAQEKCYFSAYLFLKANTYRCVQPFADVFGVTSRLVLNQYPTLDTLSAIPVTELAAQLNALSRHHLRNPQHNAQQLHTVAEESFLLPQRLTTPVHRILTATLAGIAFLEQQIAQVETWIAAELPAHPGIQQLLSIPGVGPVFAAGIGAEIGGTQRFLNGTKWDRRKRRYRPKNLRDAEDGVAKLAGLWWPRANSGGFEAEDRRMAKSGNAYLRYYLIQAANQLRMHIPEYRRFYRRKFSEAAKHKHKRALVLTARKSVGLVVGLLHRNEPYRSEEERRT